MAKVRHKGDQACPVQHLYMDTQSKQTTFKQVGKVDFCLPFPSTLLYPTTTTTQHQQEEQQNAHKLP